MNENKARAVADAIFNDDAESYSIAMERANITGMARSELVKFRGLVHDLVDEMKSSNDGVSE